MLRVLVTGRRVGFVMLAVIILIGIVVLWRWFRPLPVVYVAVAQPELADGVPPELMDILRINIDERLKQYRRTYTLKAREVDAVDGGSEAIARALGVDEIVYTTVRPSSEGVRVELVREVVAFNNQREFTSDRCTVIFPSPDAPRPLVGIVSSVSRQ